MKIKITIKDMTNQDLLFEYIKMLEPNLCKINNFEIVDKGIDKDHTEKFYQVECVIYLKESPYIKERKCLVNINRFIEWVDNKPVITWYD